MPVATIRRLQKTLPADAEVFTPYGATECLPVASVSGTELNTGVEQLTATGEGTCVGRPVAPNNVKIIAVTDGIVESFEDSVELPVGIIGEIVVNGPTTTDTYWQKPEQTATGQNHRCRGQIPGTVWVMWVTSIPMAVYGTADANPREWLMSSDCLYADQVEAIFNVHPEVARTALVGIGSTACKLRFCVWSP